ncbi:uncharacterized protein BKA55DRAFT_586774, partial [Fusarium redolens]
MPRKCDDKGRFAIANLYVCIFFVRGAIGPEKSPTRAQDVLILARIICKAFWIGAVYMLERFLYSLPPRGTSLLVASSTVVVGEARPIDINT